MAARTKAHGKERNRAHQDSCFRNAPRRSGCSHAQTKPDQSQAQALREPRPAAKPMTTARSQDNENGFRPKQSCRWRSHLLRLRLALLRATTLGRSYRRWPKRRSGPRPFGSKATAMSAHHGVQPGLGDARARSAATYLERLGVRKNRISTVSYGSERRQGPGP